MRLTKSEKDQIAANIRGFLPARKTIASVSFALCLLILLPLTITAQKHNPQQAANIKNIREWLGSYSFEDQATVPKRRKFTDAAPYAAYDITIERMASGRLIGFFNANGTQRFEAYECSVKTSADKTEFYFEKLRTNVNGTQDLRKFKKGEMLFSLRLVRIGKQTKYLFKTAAYDITRLDKAKRNQPVYFTKQ